MSPHLNVQTLKSNDSFPSLSVFMHVTYSPESYIIILSLFQHEAENRAPGPELCFIFLLYLHFSRVSIPLVAFSLMVILKFDTNVFCLLCFKEEHFMQGPKHRQEKLLLKIPERLSSERVCELCDKNRKLGWRSCLSKKWFWS